MNICKTLGDGVNFHYIHSDKFTTDYFSVHFLLPLSEKTVAGYSLLTKLFKKGTRAYPTQAALATRLEELYDALLNVSVSKQGEAQMLSLGIDMLSSRFVFDESAVVEEGSTLLSDILADPYLENGSFSSAVVEREKRALKDQLHASVNDKKKYALQRCREIMCEGEVYSLALEGTDALIDAVTPSSLYALYKKMLREARIEIFYIGSELQDVAEKRAIRLVERFGERSPVPCSTTVKSKAETIKRVFEPIDAVQGKLAMGFRTGLSSASTLKERDALVLFNLIYGGSAISKLFMNVREKLSLCYYCISRNDNQKGVLFVHSGVENENAEKAETEILFQLGEIQKGNITEEEMLCAKQALRDLTRSVSDSPFTLEQWYLTRAVADDDRSPEQMYLAIEELTVADVAQAASRISLDTVFLLKGEPKAGGQNEKA